MKSQKDRHRKLDAYDDGEKKEKCEMRRNKQNCQSERRRHPFAKTGRKEDGWEVGPHVNRRKRSVDK